MSEALAAASAAASTRLPAEILSQIFLEVDPHTLYTSVRALSRDWKASVEDRLLASEFKTGRWRVGLKITRKPKVGLSWRGGHAGASDWEAPGAIWNRLSNRAIELAKASGEDGEANKEEYLADARKIYTKEVLSRHGALEDELDPSLVADDVDLNAPVVQVIPLEFKRYDGASTTLQFTTPQDEMYALFEHGNDGGDPSRLDLDFGIVWRFPGDGQDQDGWGDADQENGWLSRFYCSTFDLENSEKISSEENLGSQVRLRSTPLARRVRRAVTGPNTEDDEEVDEDEEEDATHSGRRQTYPSSTPLEWTDNGHEYASMSLSLGTEFFVRRSARANQLLRRLEAAAAAAQSHSMQKGKQRRKCAAYSAASTPLRRSSRPSPSSSGTPTMSLHHQLLDTAITRSLYSQTPFRHRSSVPSSEYCSGSSTPASRSSSSSAAVAWKSNGKSYALVASTPPSEPTSRRSSFFSASGPGPRVVRATPFKPNGSMAPLPSVNVSGYSSVKHQAPIDEKEIKERQDAEGAALEEGSEDSSFLEESMSGASTVSKGHHSQMAVSSHNSVPRAHFTAQMVRLHRRAKGPMDWQGGDAYQRQSVRRHTLSRRDTLTVWEWCR